MNRNPSLIVFVGLPGTGKTTLAAALAARLRCANIRIDGIGAALRRAGATPDPVRLADYFIAEAVAETTLRAGATVVIDAVNPVEDARESWRALARRCGAEVRFVELICSDPQEHRRRVELRDWDTPELRPPTWADVLAREFEPLNYPRLTLDTTSSIDECVARAVTYVGL